MHLNHIDLIITTDTALTHIATKYNIKNIVIFKSGFWDSMSLQSLAAESPMSFISENSCQLPVVLPQIENKDFHKVLDIMNSIQNANRFETDKTYNFCSYKYSLFKNIALLRLRRLLGPKRKLMHYKKGK